MVERDSTIFLLPMLQCKTSQIIQIVIPRDLNELSMKIHKSLNGNECVRKSSRGSIHLENVADNDEDTGGRFIRCFYMCICTYIHIYTFTFSATCIKNIRTRITKMERERERLIDIRGYRERKESSLVRF